MDFWTDYERAVNDMSLSEVDRLEELLVGLPFNVRVDDRTYSGSKVDLQIYPSTGRFSFTLPKDGGGEIQEVPG